MARRSVPLGLQSIDTNGNLTECGYAEALSQSLALFTHIIVRYSCVCRHAVIPQCHRSVIPFHTRLDVLARGDVLSIASALHNMRKTMDLPRIRA